MNILRVTLWDKFVLDFDDSCVSEKDKNIFVMIILAGMTVRSYKGMFFPKFFIYFFYEIRSKVLTFHIYCISGKHYSLLIKIKLLFLRRKILYDIRAGAPFILCTPLYYHVSFFPPLRTPGVLNDPIVSFFLIYSIPYDQTS